jgi:hypothetical protein
MGERQVATPPRHGRKPKDRDECVCVSKLDRGERSCLETAKDDEWELVTRWCSSDRINAVETSADRDNVSSIDLFDRERQCVDRCLFPQRRAAGGD